MTEKFKISLLDNGIHSFNRGLDKLLQYRNDNNKDDFKLKEAIMFLHHGIELLLKEVLIRNGGEFLIFDDIKPETIKKIIQAKDNNTSVFNLDKPVHTATYLDIIQRVRAFVNTPQLDESLASMLIELNKQRNSIEHYGIDIEKTKVFDNLLLKLYRPISEFFKKAGIELDRESQEKWNKIESQLRKEVSGLRGGGSIKKAELKDGIVTIEYVESFEEYKNLQPQSSVTKEELDSYWDSGDAILKAINDGGVRLMRKIDEIKEIHIKIPFKDKIYSVNIKRDDLENFLGCKMDEIIENWDSLFSNPYVYSKDGRQEFFKVFGRIDEK